MFRYIESYKIAVPVLRSVRLLEQLRERIRYLHYSLQTETPYLNWVRLFIHAGQFKASFTCHQSTGPQCIVVSLEAGAVVVALIRE